MCYCNLEIGKNLRSPCVKAPRDSSLFATIDANLFSPPRFVKRSLQLSSNFFRYITNLCMMQNSLKCEHSKHVNLPRTETGDMGNQFILGKIHCFRQFKKHHLIISTFDWCTNWRSFANRNINRIARINLLILYQTNLDRTSLYAFLKAGYEKQSALRRH